MNKNIQDIHFSRLFCFDAENSDEGEGSVVEARTENDNPATVSGKESSRTGQEKVNDTSRSNAVSSTETQQRSGSEPSFDIGKIRESLPRLAPTKQSNIDYNNFLELSKEGLSPEDYEKILKNYKNLDDYSTRTALAANTTNSAIRKRPKDFLRAQERAQKYFRIQDAINNGDIYRSADGRTFHWVNNGEWNALLGDDIRSFYGDDASRGYENKADYDNVVAEDYLKGRALSELLEGGESNYTFDQNERQFLQRNPEFAQNILRRIAQDGRYGVNLNDFQGNPELQNYYASAVLNRLKSEGRLSDAVEMVGVRGFNGRNGMREDIAYTGLSPVEIRAVDHAFTNKLVDRKGNFIDQNAKEVKESTPQNQPRYPDFTNGYDKVITARDFKTLPKSLQEISKNTPSTIIWRYHPKFKEGTYLVQDPGNPTVWRSYKEDGTAIGDFQGNATPFTLEKGVRVNPQLNRKEFDQIEKWRNLSKHPDIVDLEEVQLREGDLGYDYSVDSNGNVQTAHGTQPLSVWAKENGVSKFDYNNSNHVFNKDGTLTPRAQRHIERYNAMSPEQKAEYDAKNPWFKQFLAGVNRSENSALNRTIAQPGLKWKDWSDTQKFGTMAGLGLGSLAFMSMLGKDKKDWFDYLMMLGVPIASIFGGSYLGNYLDPRTNPGTYNAKAYADYIKNAQKQAADAAKVANNTASGNK